MEDGNNECVCNGSHGDLRKRQFSFNEILHLKEPLVGSLGFFHFGTEEGRVSKKISSYFDDSISFTYFL